MAYILADQEVENWLGMDQGHKSQGALLSSLCQLAKLCVFKVLQTPKLSQTKLSLQTLNL